MGLTNAHNNPRNEPLQRPITSRLIICKISGQCCRRLRTLSKKVVLNRCKKLNIEHGMTHYRRYQTKNNNGKTIDRVLSHRESVREQRDQLRKSYFDHIFRLLFVNLRFFVVFPRRFHTCRTDSRKPTVKCTKLIQRHSMIKVCAHKRDSGSVASKKLVMDVH